MDGAVVSGAFERIRDALIERTGHHYYTDKERLLRARLRERQDALGLADIERYEERLIGAGAESEWRALEDAITIGETYFFRYADHFDALRHDVLPRLIEARRPIQALRIWSIGCSNGAEPYSLAIVLRELLGGEVDDWRINIIGGDISEKSLAAAREARYGQWALRTMGPAERDRYFDKVDARSWRLKAPYRGMVRFERQNLLDLLSPTPPLAWDGYDLILCRNVLIYFSPEAAIQMAAALRARLAGDGALILGHAEATLLANPAHILADATSEFGQALLPAQPLLPPAPVYEPPAALAPIAKPVRAPPVMAAPAATVSSPSISGDELDTLHDLADAGAYQRAHALCQELIARHPTSAALRYYEALLAHVTDDGAGAETALRRALYLDRSFILAHYRLGLLLLGRQQRAEAKRSLAIAAQLASRLPADAPVPHGQGVNAATFAQAVRSVLDEAA